MAKVPRAGRSVYVGFKYPHMGSHAGYDLVRRHAGYELFVDCQSDYRRLRTFLSGRTLLARVYARLLADRLWWVEWRCFGLALRHRGLVFHFVYAGSTYRYLGWLKWLGFRVVCTYHQPASFYCTHPEPLRGVRLADDIIVLSEDSARLFARLAGPTKVHVVRHGVDADFFSPDPSTQPARELLMVGSWLRDFTFADQVFRALLRRDGCVQIHVVANVRLLGALTRDPRLHLHHGIPDEELLRRYRSAALLFLPLTSYVACNAVVEAASVGLRILIASSQRGSQLPERFVEYVPMRVEAAVERIATLLDAPDPLAPMRREWVVRHLSWPVIGAQTAEILRPRRR